MDVGCGLVVKTSFSTNSKLARLLQTLAVDDDKIALLLHNKVCLEQVVELVLLCFLHLRTEHLMGYITHVVLQKVSNTRKDNQGWSLSTAMKVDSGASQHSKRKRLTKALTRFLLSQSTGCQPVAGSYLERVVQWLQGYFLYWSEVYMWILGGTQKNKYMYLAHKSVTDSNIE